ncbi:type III pantothenate kinase [Aurantibacter sp.]|uniref:type III pantothenate kinase n=1 Tax=Aurantibacter sp. TaxID=2807103 RepID=UPI0035C847CF
MNLIIDAGNSYVKIAVFQNNNLIFVDSVSYKSFFIDLTNVLKNHPNIKYGILSSVGAFSSNDIYEIDKRICLIEVRDKIKLPFSNLYKTINTLGKDRLALISASMINYTKENVLVIDAGTCITFDFKNKDDEYLGGAISPGINMRYNSLNYYTSSLPLLKKEVINGNYLGNSTEACMHSGVVNGVVQEIDGVVAQYKSKYKDLTVILTGGDANFLSLQLKSSIFANSNFLLEGLNYLLNYNLKE